jgi:5-methylcytosine-specific restriction endonuclease McrA
MKIISHKCIGLTNTKKICNRKILYNHVYCSIHKTKLYKNSLNSVKPILKRELIKTISHKTKEILTNKELLYIHKAKVILTSSFTRCYICDNTHSLTIDHIIPIINKENNEYGKDNNANTILCCSKCNQYKSNKGLEHVIQELKKHTKNKLLLYRKICAIKTIYSFRPKLILKKKFIHSFSVFFVNNILNLLHKFISKYIEYCDN